MEEISKVDTRKREVKMSDTKDLALGYILIANNYLDQGKSSNAIRTLERGVSQYPGNIGLHTNLANAYAQTKDWRGAFNEYLISFKLDPQCYKDLVIPMATALFNLGEFDDAIRGFEIGLNIDPDNISGRFLLAQCYQKQGRSLEALKEYKIVVLNFQGDMLARTHFLMGDLYREHGQLDEAVREYQASLSVKRKQADVHFWLGKCYQQMGLVDEANSEYKIAKKMGHTRI